jgi:hypothetical protein
VTLTGNRAADARADWVETEPNPTLTGLSSGSE